MKTLTAMFGEFIGLFVDDGSLALAILAVVILAGIFAILMPQAHLVVGAILLLGCLGALMANVVSAARH